MKLLQRAVVLGATAVSVVVLVPPALASASVKLSNLPNGQVGVPYSQKITATGGTAPYTFTLASGTLPAGIMLGSDGTVSGTAQANETGSFTVRASDSSSPALTGTKTYTLYFGLVFSTKSLSAANVGTAYSKQIVVKGGTAPLTFSVSSGSPPPGITVSSSGLVSGTPTTPGAFTFTVGVADSGSPQQTNSQAFTVKVGLLGQWTLCTYSSGVGGNNNDNVTLASGGTMRDSDGTTGTWKLSSTNKLTMAFNFRNFVGNWDTARSQFDGTYTGPDNGTFAMVPGSNNGQNCQP